MAHDVFISHSHDDKVLADAVCASLESSGIRCWIAPRDVLAGRDWAASIVEAIETARVMVLVYSASSANSEHVKKELTLAVKAGAVIVPLRIEDVPLSGMMEYYLMGTHWLDAMNPPSQHEISVLVDTVKTLLDAPVRGADAVTPADTTQAAPEGGPAEVIRRAPQRPAGLPAPPPPPPPGAAPTGQPAAWAPPSTYVAPQQTTGAPDTKNRSGLVIALIAIAGIGILLTLAGACAFFAFLASPTPDTTAETPAAPVTEGTSAPHDTTAPSPEGGRLTLAWDNTDDLDIELYSGSNGDYLGSAWDIGGYDSMDGTAEDEYLDLLEIDPDYWDAEGYFIAVINNSTERQEWVPFTLTLQTATGKTYVFESRVNAFPPQDEWIACWIDARTGDVLSEVRLYVDGTADGSAGTGDASGVLDEYY